MKLRTPLTCVALLAIFPSLTPSAFAQAPATAAAAAGDRWTLTTTDFKTEQVVLKGIDASGLKVAAVAAEGDAATAAVRDVPLEQFLDVQRPASTSQTAPAAAAAAKFALLLTGGDKLGGEPVNLTAEALVWRNATLGEIAIPTTGVTGFTRPGGAAPAEQGREDVVTLANGDVVKGIIASMNGQTVTVQAGGGGANSDVPLASVASISFAATPGGGPPKHGFRARLDDGSSLVGTAARVAGDALVLTLAKGADRNIPLAHVAGIEQVNGPVSWLSARSPVEAVYYPFIGPARQPAMYADRAWGGPHPIEFKGTQFAHGIAVHAYSRLAWAIPDGYSAFRTRFAVEGDSAGLADVTVRVKLDDKVVFEKEHVRAGTLSAPVVLDLKGAKTLVLEVDGGAAYAQDALDWIEPALLKNVAPAAPQ